MKKNYKRLLVLTLTLCLLLTSAGSAFAFTRVTFGSSQQTVDTFNGVPAYYKIGNHDNDSTYSCAAFVKRYYSTIYNVSVSNMLYNRFPAVSEAGYKFRQVDWREAAPGDVGYQDGSGGGHWFIVKTVNGKTLTVIEQNWKDDSTHCKIDRDVTFGTTKNLKVFKLQKNGADVNGKAVPNNGIIKNGRYAIMANSTYCVNVQFASKVSDAAKLVIDKYNGEPNEEYDITEVETGYYRISPVHAPNLALNAQYGASAKAGQQLSCHTWQQGDAASLWSVEKYNGGYRFRNKANKNLYIDVAHDKKSTTGNKINLWTKVNGSQQTFTLKSIGGSNTAITVKPSVNVNTTTTTKDWSGRYAIKANNNYCLNVQYASRVSDQAKCVIDPYNGEPNEIYNFTRYGNYYRISPVHAPNLALNAQYGASAKAGQQLSLHTWRDGDAASLWSIEGSQDGVRFRNKANPSLIIDVNNGWKDSVGNRINLWTQNDSYAQVFYLVRA